jgi:plastocyanin
MLLSALALTIAAPAWAADLTVSLRTPAGKPVADAVVMVAPQAGVPKGPIHFAWPLVMAQKNLTFVPFVLVAPVGADVAFPNQDLVLHHVYSFSPAKTFELKLYSKDETRNVRFDKPGVVAIGCNIHDDMSAYIRVVDTPYAGKSGADGEVTIAGVPAGPLRVTIWHPYLKAPRGEVAQTAVAPASGALRLAAALDLRAAPMKHGAY